MERTARCSRTPAVPSRRDALMGAGVMVGVTLLLTAGGLAARTLGWPAVGDALAGFSFPAALTLSMPFWLMKGQPRRAQAAIVGGTLLVLSAIATLAAMF